MRKITADSLGPFYERSFYKFIITVHTKKGNILVCLPQYTYGIIWHQSPVLGYSNLFDDHFTTQITKNRDTF